MTSTAVTSLSNTSESGLGTSLRGCIRRAHVDRSEGVRVDSGCRVNKRGELGLSLRDRLETWKRLVMTASFSQF